MICGQTLTPLADGPGYGQRNCFCHIWNLNHSQQCDHSHLLQLKIIIETVQTDDEGPSRSSGKVAST
jgi:hypothetical protein